MDISRTLQATFLRGDDRPSKRPGLPAVPALVDGCMALAEFHATPEGLQLRDRVLVCFNALASVEDPERLLKIARDIAQLPTGSILPRDLHANLHYALLPKKG